MNLCMDVQTSIPRYAPGEPYLGATWRILPGPGPHPGRLIAWDPTLGAIRWEVGEPYPLLGGALATASGLVFYATTDGWFKAVDQANGHERWRYRLPGGSIGAPITFLDPEGRQSIALLIGVGGWLSLPNAAAVRPATWADGTTGMLLVFRLPTEQVP
jgi:alcohol dehydrogenase (cytochrome c)